MQALRRNIHDFSESTRAIDAEELDAGAPIVVTAPTARAVATSLDGLERDEGAGGKRRFTGISDIAGDLMPRGAPGDAATPAVLMQIRTADSAGGDREPRPAARELERWRVDHVKSSPGIPERRLSSQLT